MLLWMTLAAQTCTLGADDEGMLATAGHLAKFRLGENAEAEAICRASLEKHRRILGRGHGETLSAQGNHTEGLEIRREVLVQKTLLLASL